MTARRAPSTSPLADTTDAALDQIRRLWNTLESTPLHRGTKEHTAIVRQIRLKADVYLRLLDRAKSLAALRSRTNRENDFKR